MGKHTVTNALHIASKYCADMTELHDIVIKIQDQEEPHFRTSVLTEVFGRVRVVFCDFLGFCLKFRYFTVFVLSICILTENL